jgi:hypothetical protein
MNHLKNEFGWAWKVAAMPYFRNYTGIYPGLKPPTISGYRSTQYGRW